MSINAESVLRAGLAELHVSLSDAQVQGLLDYQNLMEGYESISRAFPLPQYKVSVVHGQMKSADKDADTRALENDLSAALNMRVAIDHGMDGGSITVHYRTLEDLDFLCAALSVMRRDVAI